MRTALAASVRRVHIRVAASAVAHNERVREAALERDLGVRHEARKPSGPREIVGIDEAECRLFSTRRAQVEGRLAEMVAAYTESHGAAPSAWVVAQMSRTATLSTRPRKHGTETTAEALARWEAQTTAELETTIEAVWASATAAGRNGDDGADPTSDEALLACAVAAVDEAKSTWTRYDLARELTKGLAPDPLLDAAAQLARVDRLVEHTARRSESYRWD